MGKSTTGHQFSLAAGNGRGLVYSSARTIPSFNRTASDNLQILIEMHSGIMVAALEEPKRKIGLPSAGNALCPVGELDRQLADPGYCVGVTFGSATAFIASWSALSFLLQQATLLQKRFA